MPQHPASAKNWPGVADAAAAEAAAEAAAAADAAGEAAPAVQAALGARPAVVATTARQERRGSAASLRVAKAERAADCIDRRWRASYDGAPATGTISASRW
jgi:hypothetical protein